MKLKELLHPLSNRVAFETFFEGLPTLSKVFWYVSAGTDFRGPVYLSDHHIEHQKKHHKENLKKPDLYLFNCLGSEVKKLEGKLKQSKPTNLVIFEDDFTVIKAIEYIPVKMDRDRLNYQICADYIEQKHVEDPLEYQDNDAFLLTIQIESLSDNFTEIVKVIYLQMENINCFQNLIVKEKAVAVQYLCATREGNGFGSCKRSIIKEIYDSDDHYQTKGFDPEYVITFDDFTNEIFLSRMLEKGREVKQLASLPYECKSPWIKNNNVYHIIK